jgi:hypothetical protein
LLEVLVYLTLLTRATISLNVVPFLLKMLICFCFPLTAAGI